MGSSESKPTENPATIPVPADQKAGDKPKCKACCACPETKKARDEW